MKESEKGLPFDRKIRVEGWRFVDEEEYEREHERTLSEDFWLSEAQKIEWFSKPKKATEGKVPFVKWFPDGVLNISYLCLDRHIRSRKNKVALFWVGEDGRFEALTYGMLLDRVVKISWVLKNKLGLRKGDVVAVYMPQTPDVVALLLALARIGVTFTVVFSGFSGEALAQRIEDAGARYLFTSDGYTRRGKKILMQEKVREAVEKAPVEKVVVFPNIREGWSKESSDVFIDELFERTTERWVEPEKLPSEHNLFILYTSGTTGKPKGIVRDTGGYAVLLNSTVRWVFDLRDDDVFWCTADVGWITGHSYLVFGPLLAGATEVMYDGVPDYPHPGIWWEICERFRVTVFYTSPTAIRMLTRYPEDYVKRYDLSSLRILHSVGEPINPEAWMWFFKNVGGGRCPVGSTWWMTETGGVMISHTPGWLLVPLKPGSNGLAIPGVKADVVDAEGRSVRAGERGYLVLKNPWPGMLKGIWKDEKRYVETYWERFKGIFWTGDWAVKDDDGHIWVLGRADEAMNVAGHRIGTYEIESALVSDPAVAESAVVGIPDPVKGEVPVAFCVLREGVQPSKELEKRLEAVVRKTIGPIAVPKKIVFVGKLPKTRSGKIMRRLVRAVFLRKPLGDTTTLEDEASVEEVKRAYEEFKREMEREGEPR